MSPSCMRPLVITSLLLTFTIVKMRGLNKQQHNLHLCVDIFFQLKLLPPYLLPLQGDNNFYVGESFKTKYKLRKTKNSVCLTFLIKGFSMSHYHNFILRYLVMYGHLMHKNLEILEFNSRISGAISHI